MLSPKDFGSHLMLYSSAIAVKILSLVCPSGALADSFSTNWKVVRMEGKSMEPSYLHRENPHSLSL